MKEIILEVRNLLCCFDTSFIILCIVMGLDIVSGIISSAYNKSLSSSVGARGIPKKVGIVIVIVVTCLLEGVLGTEVPITGAVILFYIVNETISILENASSMGVGIPKKLKDLIDSLRDNEVEE